MVHDLLAKIRRIFSSFETSRSESENEVTATWTFDIRVEADPLDGGYVAECLDLPGALGQGDTPQEARRDLNDAIAAVLETRLSAGEPEPDHRARPLVRSA